MIAFINKYVALLIQYFKAENRGATYTQLIPLKFIKGYEYTKSDFY
jgi:hypothetical protein